MTPELYWVEAPASGRLAVAARPRGGLWLEDDLVALRAAGVDTLVCMMVPGELPELQLVHEPELAVAAGLRFTWLPVPDLSTPTNDDVLNGIRKLSDEVGRDGPWPRTVGRALGARRCASRASSCCFGVPPREAWQRIALSRGRAVPDTAAQGRWVESLTSAGTQSFPA